MKRSLEEIRRGVAQEVERMRTADLSTEQGFRDNVVFHIGFMDMTVYDLLCRVEELEKRPDGPRIYG